MKSFKGFRTKLKLNGNDVEKKDKYYTLSVNANNWRKMCFSLMVVVVFLSAVLTKIALTKKVNTFIVEKSGNQYTVIGDVSSVAEVQKKASEQEVIYFLNEVIDGIKGLPRNTEVYEKNYRKALSYLSRSAAKKIDNYLKEEDYVK